MAIRRGWPVLGLFALLVACEADRGRLVVQVRSDLTPVLELTGVGVDIAGQGPDRVWDAFVEVNPTQRWGAGVRIAEFADLPLGTTLLRVGAEGPDGASLVERDVRVELRSGVNAVTVLLTRDCAGVECPASNPAETACLAGRCVRPECTEETPEACGERDCTTPAECPAAAVACAERVCTTSGACVELPRDDGCPGGQVCSTRLGCVSTSEPSDAGIDDAGIGDAGVGADAGAPAACAPGAISLFGPPLEALRGPVSLASAGSSLVVASMSTLPARAYELTQLPLDGSPSTAMLVAAAAGDTSDAIAVEYGDVGGGRYEIAWVVAGVLYTQAFERETLASVGPRDIWADAAYGAMSLAYNARDQEFALMLERDDNIALILLYDGTRADVVPTDRMTTSPPARDPILFWMSGLFAGLWTDSDPTHPLRFEAISPSGGATESIELPMAPGASIAYAAGWPTAAGTLEFWVARAQASGDNLIFSSHSETGEYRRGGSTPIPGVTEIRSSPREMELDLALVHGSVGAPRVAWVQVIAGRRDDVTPSLDATLRAEPELHVDDIVHAAGAQYVAVRSTDYARIVRICDP